MNYRNVTVAVDVIRVYKVNALVRLRVNGGKVELDADQQPKDINPRYFNGTVEFLVPRTSIEGLP
jgi:hypothetical protein